MTVLTLTQNFSDAKLNSLYVDFNSYFASVEQQTRPETRGRPVVVVPSMTEATCAIAASYEAKALGIKTGTKIYEAKKLCPELICVQADHQKYIEFHEAILHEVDKYIPIHKVYSVDEFVCKLQGKEQTVQGAINLAKQIKKGIHENVGGCITSSIGVAQNRFLAKLATEIEKPNGLVLLQGEDLPHKLFQLKLSDICGIGKSMEYRLRMNGIATIADLYSLSPKHMRSIWHSVGGERMWYNLRGYDLPDVETNKTTIGHSHILAPERRPQKKAKIVAQRLTLKAASRLRRYGMHAKAMDLSVRFENGPKVGYSKNFYQANDNFTFLEVLKGLWSAIGKSYIPNARIKKVSITLHNLIEDDKIQPEFFDDNKIFKDQFIVQKHEKVSVAMDKLNSKYGRDTIVIGFSPNISSDFSGTKIAFNRIPESQEFYE